MKHFNLPIISLLMLGLVFQTGCVRLWGGAGYTREKPGETVQKTYILDTGEFANQKQAQGSIQ